MSIEHDKCKILPLFKATLIAAIFTSALSQTTSVKAREKSELNIETRLAKVRERLKQIKYESDILSSLENSMETEKDKTIQAQYWSDGWNDWSNWSDGWNDWSDWSDGWSNWDNYY